jgi:hypothetical protein
VQSCPTTTTDAIRRRRPPWHAPSSSSRTSGSWRPWPVVGRIALRLMMEAESAEEADRRNARRRRPPGASPPVEGARHLEEGEHALRREQLLHRLLRASPGRKSVVEQVLTTPRDREELAPAVFAGDRGHPPVARDQRDVPADGRPLQKIEEVTQLLRPDGTRETQRGERGRPSERASEAPPRAGPVRVRLYRDPPPPRSVWRGGAAQPASRCAPLRVLRCCGPAVTLRLAGTRTCAGEEPWRVGCPR